MPAAASEGTPACEVCTYLLAHGFETYGAHHGCVNITSMTPSTALLSPAALPTHHTQQAVLVPLNTLLHAPCSGLEAGSPPNLVPVVALTHMPQPVVASMQCPPSPTVKLHISLTRHSQAANHITLMQTHHTQQAVLVPLNALLHAPCSGPEVVCQLHPVLLTPFVLVAGGEYIVGQVLERSRETPLLALAGFELPPKGRRLVPMNHCAT
jgi:hypothetical protein